ncbi:hypothetical protein R3I93_010121 [Phoxinus phoxinus]|uniref:HECT domain-containing protein n=1 Tax=Phoxinus phoxinus TaxID=58324 RepID=A0AAN9C709_9TELE
MTEQGGSSQKTNIESAVRVLLNCIQSERERPPSHQNTTAQPTATVPTSSRPVRPATVQTEMQRCFPSLYSGGQKRKRKSSDTPRVSAIKFMELQFCLQPENTDKTPKDEAVLLQAGLGRRTINMDENVDHTEISRVLLEEFPKMRDLRGGWLLTKASGGSGQRKTTPLPQGAEGYTAKVLKSSSNNGKNVIYIVPLQEKIDTTPLPFDAAEFARMPKNACMTCGKLIPLPLIQFHIESCGYNKDEFEEEADQTVVDHPAEQESDLICVDSCPICGKQFPAEIVAYHASSCGESFADIISTSTLPDSESSAGASFFSVDSTLHTRPSTSATLPVEDMPLGSRPVQTDDLAWKGIVSPELAADHYRRQWLQKKEDEPTLKIKLDIGEDVEEQEGTILNFYKAPYIDWARPFQAKLQGDLAIGDGVNRHFLSMVMHKLQHGFTVDFGNACGTLLFEGQPDHLIPSTSQVLAQNEMFIMAGRMIGHSFLHGGPRLTGLSPAVLHVLLGGTPQTATITLEDVADLDIKETIRPLFEDEASKNQCCGLTEDQRAAVNELALAWDLPVLTKTNRTWLLHNLLQHAVLGRNARQLKQFKQGLRESLILPLLESRPDTVLSVFPRQSMAECSAEVILDHIKWPDEGGLEDDGDDSGYSIDIKCRIMGYLRQFMKTVSQEQLKQLVKFWVGWEIPMANMKVEVVRAEYPTSSTCYRMLRLPGYYKSYSEFSVHLENCIATNDSGFGLL